jgi:two-component system, chemotaxis family, sensor kinase CheA
VVRGEDTELDKTVVEKIADPLTHLVRNAIDHGIEAADVRQARGKPAIGTVTLNAYHDSGSIVIEVSDDGGGLKRDKILAKAIERGLVEEGHPLSDGEVYGFIFADNDRGARCRGCHGDHQAKDRPQAVPAGGGARVGDGGTHCFAR